MTGQPGALRLQLLALQGPTPRPRVAELVWPDICAARAAASLRQR